MKIIITLLGILFFSSCDKLNRIMDGTENLPNQIQETNDGMKKTNEAIRKQKMGEALKMMLDENNRKTLAPIPSNMMSPAKTFAEAVKVDESLLFVKNYLIKVNEENFTDTYPLAEPPTEPQPELAQPVEPQAPIEPQPDADGNVDPAKMLDYKNKIEAYKIRLVEYQNKLLAYVDYQNMMRDYQNKLLEYQNLNTKFNLNKIADLQMITLISGFLPDATVAAMVEKESEQGTYRSILFQILKMRANFYNDIMLDAGMLDGDKKLETLGQIDKAIEYTEKLGYICNLEFGNRIALDIKGFSEELNTKLSKPLDKDLALNKWKKIKERAMADFKLQSLSTDPDKNKADVEEYAANFKILLEKIDSKIKDHTK